MSEPLEFSQVHADAIEAMKGQLIIVLVNRLGGKVTTSLEEIDGTGRYLLTMRVDRSSRRFIFEVRKKQ